MSEQLARFNNTTVEAAINAYELHLQEKGTGEISRAETLRRLRLFLPQHELAVARVTPERAQEYYDDFRKGRSVDYHRNTLAEVKTFARWWTKQGWTSSSAFEEIEGVGRRNAGKPQLTGDEAHKLYEWLMWKVSRRSNDTEIRDSNAALALLLCLTLALRQKDVRRRLVRDVDLNATQLRVGMTADCNARGKTKKSNRPRRVPSDLQPLLRQLVAGRQPLEPLFPAGDGGFHTTTWLRKAMKRFCRDAGVPYVCPHSLKGTAGSVLADEGESAEAIARHLSHERTSTSERHYIADGAVEAAQAERAFQVFSGGKR